VGIGSSLWNSDVSAASCSPGVMVDVFNPQWIKNLQNRDTALTVMKLTVPGQCCMKIVGTELYPNQIKLVGNIDRFLCMSLMKVWLSLYRYIKDL
jgi:hypothetical protein